MVDNFARDAGESLGFERKGVVKVLVVIESADGAGVEWSVFLYIFEVDWVASRHLLWIR